MPQDVSSSILAITTPPTRDVVGEDHDILLLCRAPTPMKLILLASFPAALRGILISLAHFSVALGGN